MVQQIAPKMQQKMLTPTTKAINFKTYYKSWTKYQLMLFNAHNNSLSSIPSNIHIESSQPVILMNRNHMNDGEQSLKAFFYLFFFYAFNIFPKYNKCKL